MGMIRGMVRGYGSRPFMYLYLVPKSQKHQNVAKYIMLSISCMEYMGLNGPGIDFACNGASEGCAARCRVQLLEWRVRSGAGCGAVAGCCFKVCALWSWHVGAIAGCHCRVPFPDFSQKQQEA